MRPAFDQLDRRLSRSDARPVAVALSGGGDSLALLQIAAQWARSNGRRLLALTVDHGLNPDSGRWTAFAGEAAGALGAEWRRLAWTDPKPSAGLPAAARRARHALLAEAARAAGASVILTGHTTDDAAENAWMRNHGSTLGLLRAWTPSPVWPEGRGLMLLRPLLGLRRAALREYLRERGQAWIEDPANEDARHLRVQARRALAGVAIGSEPDHASPLAEDLLVDPVSGHCRAPRDTPWLAQAVACVSGLEGLPNRDAVEAARVHLAAGRRTVVGGTAMAPDGDRIILAREAGRRPPQPEALSPGRVQVWDGRFEVLAEEPGWSVGPLRASTSRLERSDAARVKTLPAGARPCAPVLFREGAASPVLASPAVRLTCLVGERLRLATGGAETEADLVSPHVAR